MGDENTGGKDAKTLQRVRMSFRELKKGLKNLAFNRHRSEQYESYVTVAFGLLVNQLTEGGAIELRLEASTMFWGDDEVLTDDQRDSNIIYPLWHEGVRLLTIQPGLTMVELLGFYQRVMGLISVGDDLMSALWREAPPHIEWVAVDSFELGASSSGVDVEVEVSEVLRSLAQSLYSDTDDGIDFGKVSLVDLEQDGLAEPSEVVGLGGDVAAEELTARVRAELAEHETGLLRVAAAVTVDVMREDSDAEDLAGVAEAVESVVDMMLLEGVFGMINALLGSCEALATDGAASSANRELGRSLGERIERLLLDRGRVQATTSALNTWRVDDEEELRTHLGRYMRASPAVLVGMYGDLKGPRHRKLVGDILVDGGRLALPLLQVRLKGATGELRRDLLHLVLRLDPPDKLDLLRPLLDDEDPATRAEALGEIRKIGGDESFALLRSVARSHRVAQLRAQAARMLADTGHEDAPKALLEMARAEKFASLADGEQAAIISGLCRLKDEEATSFVDRLLEEKSSFLNKRKVDDRKLMVIRAIIATPGVSALERLATVARDDKLHSADVRRAAEHGILRVRTELLAGAET